MPPPDAPAAKLSESEFLAQQAEMARTAMMRSLSEIKTRLAQGADPKAWAREFPWITVGAAAVAGFAAAATLIPSKEDQALKRLAKIERALNPCPPRHESSNGDGEKKAGGGILGNILHEALSMARPLLVGLLSGGMGGMGAGMMQDPAGGQMPTGMGVPPDQQSYGGA